MLHNISKDIGKTTVLKPTDCVIKSGEFVALLGPSGGGKTTLLRTIAGLETPTTGAVLFDDVDISSYAVQERNIGMVFQRYALFPHMSVAQNITFGLDVSGVSKQDIKKRLDEILEVVQLQAFKNRFPSQLSGGQMQRVAIARTLITRPSILMLDEPLANLDAKLRAEMRAFIKKLHRQFNITTLFVTHDQAEAIELADRVAVLINGQMVQYDTPENLYQKPISTTVADFMGVDNIIPALVQTKTQVKTPMGVLNVDLSPMDCNKGDTVYGVIRAENIRLSTKSIAPQKTQQVIQGVVQDCTFAGATLKYDISCGDGTIRTCQQGGIPLPVGTPVWLSIDASCVWCVKQ